VRDAPEPDAATEIIHRLGIGTELDGEHEMNTSV
jgi:hypothetical protein